MFALTAVFILFSLFEEGEGLRNSGGSQGAGAALDFGDTVGVLADQLTFGLGTVGLVAFPVASGLLAHGLAFGFGSLAVGNAVGLFADGDALGAVEHFASFIRAFDLALGFLAFYVANSVFRLGAGSVAFGRLANGVANRRAVRVVTFP